jgi:hypothetical protein
VAIVRSEAVTAIHIDRSIDGGWSEALGGEIDDDDLDQRATI